MFKNVISFRDLKDGTVNIFDMQELLQQYQLYVKGENFLQLKAMEKGKNGR